MTTLWSSGSPAEWQRALASYDATIARQGVKGLVELDQWYRHDLPARIAARSEPHIDDVELARIAEWKMARGVWRARNLALVRSNDRELVLTTTARALATVPDPKQPIAIIAELAGVGPATASAVAAAAAPATYPFLDELVASQVPGLGTVAFTPVYYARYAAAVRERAAQLQWAPVMVERALWAHVGGKAGV